MNRVVIIYAGKLESISVDDMELDITSIKNKPIAEWFAPSNGRDGWQGLLPEIHTLLADDQAELSFEFNGSPEFKAVFENCLRENGIAQDADGMDRNSIAEARYRDAVKAEP